MKKIELHWQILIALVLAVFYGLYLTDYVHYVTWMGDLFLRALTMVIVPLILSSIISGVTNIGNAEKLGRLGLKTMSYYLLTKNHGKNRHANYDDRSNRRINRKAIAK